MQDGLPAHGKLARCLVDGLKTMGFPQAERPGDTKVTQSIEFTRD